MKYNKEDVAAGEIIEGIFKKMKYSKEEILKRFNREEIHELREWLGQILLTDGSKIKPCESDASRIMKTKLTSIEILMLWKWLGEIAAEGSKAEPCGWHCHGSRIKKTDIEEDYILGHQIGKGAYGSVQLCTDKVNGALFACKTVYKLDETVPDEFKIMQYLAGHPGIVSLKAVYEDCRTFKLVMELCDRGNLSDKVKKEGPLSETKAAFVLKELMSVIKFCHEMGVVHRDIKPSNILLTTSGHVKLADFGLSTRVSSSSMCRLVGTSPHMAPEIQLDAYTNKVDIWSAGVLLYFLLVGRPPFQVCRMEDVQAFNTSLNFNCESVSPVVSHLLQRMLNVDASLRPTADEVLKDDWVRHHTR